MHRTHHVRIDGIAVCRPGNPKICHFYFALCGNNNILRLDIPVDNMLIMGGFNPPAHLDSNADRFLKGQLPLLLNISL